MSCDDAVAAAPIDVSDMPSSTWPSEINLNKKAHTLELVWDGKHAILSHRVLRRSCRCSVCESTRRLINDVLPVADDLVLLKVEPLGSTALQLFFSDGHERGIYPWTYLKQIAFGPTTSGFTEALMKGWRDE
ncbi:gamma-butyrobetaine hydroxylase-like domain-containing protein [Noviherbaspirillum sp. Root189]|uniref:gamma-butyrobetaine hydroxylase-like domain-containing protein n=1 Tax=Noviherbaspirillum sp. Root189 TaxID=1736487 RepID=UPI00070EA71D|nr:DUF971 domain-containing protein [Noviherbaspirillum sp. Root189]KRB87044.1 hypothetical protein ASE07_20805 [Noviherbaspirillum sp. Root189]